jgi:hypothetical protein
MKPVAPALAALSTICAAVCTPALAADDAPAVRSHVYAFHALLDGQPIGEHRFTVVVDGADRKVTSEADFTVKFLGMSVFRYHHHADEQWKGDCLETLSSTTDDDGKPEKVRLERDGDTNRIATATGTTSAPGCLMSYAYWNPALRTQTRLLNPQTGKVDAVRIARVGGGTIPVDGKPVAATQWRIDAPESPIDVWVSDQGEWIGLDSMVDKGRHKLSYRL